MSPSNGLVRLALATGLLVPLTIVGSNSKSAPPPATVPVTPDGTATATRLPYTGGYTATFTVKNNQTSTVTVALTRESSANVTTTGQDYTSVTLAHGAQINVNVYYNVGAATSAYVKLWAEGSGSIDAGTWNVPVGPTAAATPDAGTAPNRLTNTNGYSETFTINNQGSGTITFALTCSGSSNVTCTGVSPSSVNVTAGTPATANANYNVGATGTGTLTLTATGGVGSDSGSFSVPVVSYGLAVTPDSGEELLRRPNGSSFNAPFTVKNTGTATDTFTFTCTAVANITCDRDGYGVYLISPSSLILAGGAQATVNAMYKTSETGTGRI